MVGHGDRFIEEKVRRLVGREVARWYPSNGVEGSSDIDRHTIDGHANAKYRFRSEFHITPFNVQDTKYSVPRIDGSCSVTYLGSSGVGVESQTATHIEAIRFDVNSYNESIKKHGFYPLGLIQYSNTASGSQSHAVFSVDDKTQEDFDEVNTNFRTNLYLSGKLYGETSSGDVLDTGLRLLTNTSSDVLSGVSVENFGVIGQGNGLGFLALAGELDMNKLGAIGYSGGGIIPLTLVHCWLFSYFIPAENFSDIARTIHNSGPIWAGKNQIVVGRGEL